MNNIILGCISSSLLLLSISSSPYHDSGGLFGPRQVFAQNLDIIKVLVADSIQALNNKDNNGAINHLKLIDQQLGISGTSVQILTSRVLVQDAIQALQSGNTNGALSHILLANQELGTPITPPTNSQTTVHPNTSHKQTPIQSFSGVSCPPKTCLPSSTIQPQFQSSHCPQNTCLPSPIPAPTTPPVTPYPKAPPCLEKTCLSSPIPTPTCPDGTTRIPGGKCSTQQQQHLTTTQTCPDGSVISIKDHCQSKSNDNSGGSSGSGGGSGSNSDNSGGSSGSGGESGSGS